MKFDYRQRTKDFFVLSKPIIVLLLLVTTYSGLVAGTQGDGPPLHSLFGHCSAARWQLLVRVR